MARTRTAILVGVAAIATIGVYVASTLLVTGRDPATALTDPAVRSAAKSACSQLDADLAALPRLPSTATLAERKALVAQQSVLVQELVDRVEQVPAATLDADPPTRSWLADWQELARARDAFAAAGLVGTFIVPFDQDQPITRRMNDVGLDSCGIPPQLVETP